MPFLQKGGVIHVPKALKRAWNIATTVLVVAVIILAVLLIGVRLFGIEPYTVLSGSMEPNYHVGSLIYVIKVDPLTLQENDPVTFYLNSGVVATHRIIEVLPDENDPNALYFRTKGDNNKTPDVEPLHSSRVIGKPIFTIPLLGFVANYIQQPPGRYIALAACMFLLVAVMLPDTLLKLLGAFKKEPDKEALPDGEPPLESKEQPTAEQIPPDEESDPPTPPTG